MLCLLGGVLRVDDTATLPPASAYVIGLVSAVTVLMRGRAPMIAVAVTTLCGALAAPLGLLSTPLVVAPVAICAFSLAAGTEWRHVISVLVPAAALLVALPPFVEEDFSWEDTSRLVTVASVPLVAAVLGRLARHRRTHLAMLEERTRIAEESRDGEARRKVVEERIRIARDLHDLVAHQITLANAQANVAVHLYNTDPDKARASLDELVATTRNALQELRATVGILRQDDDPGKPIEPAPGLSRLPELLDSFARAGLEVAVEQDGSPREVPPAVDLTLYRVAQEALTNVAKHSGAASARVDLGWTSRSVTITVTDDGGASLAESGPPGYGLQGMRERVTAVGGDLEAARTREGGFRVIATLPVVDSLDGAAR